MGKSKEPIRLRQRKTKTGLTSLYLDIYIDGQRSYEYLKLYLIPENNREDKRKNQETLKLAEAIRAFAGKEVSAEAIRRIANVYPAGKSPEVDKLRKSFTVPIRQVNAVPIPQPQSQPNQQVSPIFKR